MKELFERIEKLRNERDSHFEVVAVIPIGYTKLLGLEKYLVSTIDLIYFIG